MPTTTKTSAPGPGAAGPVLEVREISKTFGADVRVIADLSLSVYAGTFVCVVGPSGIGKTTLLRCLSGLARPTAGEVRLNGVALTGPPAEIAVVFQDYSRSLLPWLRIRDNVILPLRGKGLNRAQRQERAAEALDAVGLGYASDRYPWQVSGGMQQRVAIARALACRPALLLMDEPFASVDAQTRLDLEDLILEVHHKQNMTTLFVTHDIDEAVYLSDQVAVLGGKPASVAEMLEIELGTDRDQLDTRSKPAFAEYRARLLQGIRGGAAG